MGLLEPIIEGAAESGMPGVLDFWFLLEIVPACLARRPPCRKPLLKAQEPIIEGTAESVMPDVLVFFVFV